MFVLVLITDVTPPISYLFFNATPPTEIYTLSLHDALPISAFNGFKLKAHFGGSAESATCAAVEAQVADSARSEEHTSELQSPDLVCRLLLEKKKKRKNIKC